MALTATQIQNAYVAFFNRPADVAGLNYWSTYAGNAADLLNTFAQSAEYKALYANMNNTQVVNAVYQNLFNHAPDVAGLNYWVGQLDGGALGIGNVADAINKGAQGTDSAIITNKVTAASAFTTALDTTAEVVAYAGVNAAGINAVRAWLNTVTSDAASVTSATGSAMNNLLTTIQSNSSSGAVGQTFTLTTGVDSIVGTSGNDTINAVLDATPANGTLQLTDNINAGAGTDTVNLRVNGGVNLAATTSPILSGVEVLNVTNLAGATNIDGTTILPDLTTLNSTGGLVALTATGVSTKVKTLGLSNVAADDVDFTVTYAAGNTGTADTLVLNVSNNTSATPGTANTFAAVQVTGAATGDGFDIVNVKSTGAATRLDSLVVREGGVNASTMRTLNIEGDAGFRVNTALDFFGTSGTVDASKATGAINLAFGAEDITVTGGSGNDRFNFGATLTEADKVDGGAGTDTLAISQNIVAATPTDALVKAVNATKNMEVLELTQAAAAVAASQITAMKEFSFSGGGNTAVTATANDQTFGFTANAGATTFAPTLDDGNNVLNLKVASTATAATTVTSVGAGSYETVNLAVSGGSATEITTLTVNTNGKLVLTGASNFTTTIAGTNATIDAGAATGNLTLTGEAGNNSIIGGSGNDIINGGAGIDTIDLTKGGTDIVRVATAAANRDTINGFTAGVGGDILDVGTLNATLTANDGVAAGDFREITAASTGFTFLAANLVVEFAFNAANNSANLAAAGVLDGAELFKAIANEGSSIASITTATAQTGNIVAYQNGNAYIYAFDAGVGDTALAASEVVLVGVVNNVAVGALTHDNFA